MQEALHLHIIVHAVHCRKDESNGEEGQTQTDGRYVHT